MRNISHINPRYIWDRLGVMYHEKSKPDRPWLNNDANNILDTYLRKKDLGLEFGSGRSTLWFAKRIGFLTSVEHDIHWYENVQQLIAAASITNINYQLVNLPDQAGDVWASPYVKIVEDFEPNSLDFVLVDGKYRAYCALAVLDRIRAGGLLVIDDAQRYLPSSSYSPNSRSFGQGPKGEIWREFTQLVAPWRLIWTSSGVSDTVFFFKPVI